MEPVECLVQFCVVYGTQFVHIGKSVIRVTPDVRRDSKAAFHKSAMSNLRQGQANMGCVTTKTKVG